ncbi:MAG: MarR family transcriptional regulator [Clostridiaceae bacterium]|nr:MarR family transcriptional regulator [Clostridiaceae bacterium]
MKNNSSTKKIAHDLKEIYAKSKLYTYHRIFRKMNNGEDDSLTALEVLCLDLLQGMGSPTQTEFADYINVSKPNATYKLNTLEKKGYIVKIPSDEDRRIFHIQVTDKTRNLLNTGNRYIDVITRRMQRNFSDQELEIYEKIMSKIADEYMVEMDRYLKTQGS